MSIKSNRLVEPEQNIHRQHWEEDTEELVQLSYRISELLILLKTATGCGGHVHV